LVLVGVYTNSLEAGLGQALLEEEGIQSEIENLTSESWLAGAVLSTGFRLMVATQDAERAMDVLDRGPVAPTTAGPGEEPEGEPELGEDVEDVPGADELVHEPLAGDAVASADAARPAGREALGPTAALLLGLFVWGPITLCVACVWAVTLLRSHAGRSLQRRPRWLMTVGIVIAIAQVAAVLWMGWPRESVWWEWGESLWGWVALDVAFAAAVALGYVSASRRWPAR
jgi:hypothetical protein